MDRPVDGICNLPLHDTADNCETPPAGGARTTNPSRLTVVLDPAGGTCLGHDHVWTVRFTGSYSLPTASECSRDGFTFLGWASDPYSNDPDDILSGDIDRPASLKAVWTSLTPVPLSLTTLVNFNCEACDSVLLLWPVGQSSPDSDRVSIDASDVQCAGAGTIATIHWCWVTGLSNSSIHSASVIRSTSAGPISAIASFSLRGGPPPRLPVTA